MGWTLLFWVYLANAILLINHEIDSAYWEEWKLINPKIRNGIRGFLIIHFPMLFIVLYGLVLVENETIAGLIISLIMAAAGIFAFFFHRYHIRQGRPEFNTKISKIILESTLIISIFQVVLTIYLFF